MTEEISYIPEPPETFEEAPDKNKKKLLWIILAVVAVILICCCLLGVLAIVFWDDLNLVTNLIPYLYLV